MLVCEEIVQAELFGAANDNEPISAANLFVGLRVDLLPKTGLLANEHGIRFFYTGEPCMHGHLSPKYAKGGRCVVCALEHSASTHGREYKGHPKALRANMTRAIAATTMARTYTPSRPCKHGHMERYVASNNCVECQEISKRKYDVSIKSGRLKRLYGITMEERDEIFASQDFKCAICRDEFPDFQSAHVDHCHTTQVVRGILCQGCNQGIGLMKDSPDIMRAAALYVEKYAMQEAA